MSEPMAFRFTDTAAVAPFGTPACDPDHEAGHATGLKSFG